MADLFDAVARVAELLLAAKRKRLYQPGRVLGVNEDGTYAVSIDGAPSTVSVRQGDFPLSAGDRVWISPIDSGRPVIHGRLGRDDETP